MTSIPVPIPTLPPVGSGARNGSRFGHLLAGVVMGVFLVIPGMLYFAL